MTYDTSIVVVQFILLAEFVRVLLENHEGFDPKFPPSVRIGFSDNIVTVTISYCYHPPNSAAFAAFNEKVTLLLLEGMAKKASSFVRRAFLSAEKAGLLFRPAHDCARARNRVGLI